MPFVDWNGDWSRRPPATLKNAEIFLFVIPCKDPQKLQDTCELCVNGPSNNTIKATPWYPNPIPPFVVLAITFFPEIRSLSPNEPIKGYIDEHDVGFFIPVTLEVNGLDRGIWALNPYLYVDHPAGVILGRELFGFPKIIGEIDWRPNTMEFALDSHALVTNTPTTRATMERLLSMKHTSWWSWLLGRIASGLRMQPIPGASGQVDVVTQALASAMLGANLGGFSQLRLALLKQLRHVATPAQEGFQELVEATFTIESISAISVLPTLLWWLSPLVLELTAYTNVDIATTLGLDAQTTLAVGFRVTADLRLDGARIA